MKKLYNFIVPGVGEFVIEKDLNSLAHSSSQVIQEKEGIYTIYHHDLIIYFTPWNHKYAPHEKDLQACTRLIAEVSSEDEPERSTQPVVLDL
jgi:hypothetical protein